ncbi:MAG: glycosyltransferase family 2 protein [Flavobacteriaceae bacterium]|jgi:abequosyltransferase|nr:glycosyltransferase family 2 protein [Flavobacteriaceae bacterium]
MNSNYKLSICIPTYNRAKYLPDLLDSILLQPSGDKVEILISDNASTDNTSEVVSRYKERYQNITYYKESENLGPDKNYFKAVEISSGHYVWLMGSDDKIVSDGVLKALNCLKTNKDIYLHNRIECDINMQNGISRSFWIENVKKDWDFSEDNLADYFSSCRSLAGVFSYLSSIVVKKEKWDEFLPPKRYFQTAYSHVYPLLSILNNKATLQIFHSNIVLCRLGNDYFLQEGECKRILIDYRGYMLLSDDIFCDDNLEKSALLKILVYEYPFKKLIKIHSICRDNFLEEIRLYLRVIDWSSWKIFFARNLRWIYNVYHLYRCLKK